MPQSLAKYHIRSPRYILQPEDDTVIRLAGPKQDPWEEGTEIKDISLTGLTFTVPTDLSPSLGEFIKIQYSVTGMQQMACHALVTRLEDVSNNKTLVGVKFYRLELAQRALLTQSLALKLREQQLRKIQEGKRRLGFMGKAIPFILFLIWNILFFISFQSSIKLSILLFSYF